MIKNKVNTNVPEAVVLKPFEVTAEECGNDTTKMIKKFIKKVRKSEILKPFYGKLMYFETKSQKRRQKHMKAVYENRKKQLKEENF